jgi:hypothetical protein
VDYPSFFAVNRTLCLDPSMQQANNSQNELVSSTYKVAEVTNEQGYKVSE